MDDIIKDIEYKIERAQYYDEHMSRSEFLEWAAQLVMDLNETNDQLDDVEAMREEIEELEEKVFDAKSEARRIIQNCIDMLIEAQSDM